MQVFACQELAKTLSKVHASNNHSNVSQNLDGERERDAMAPHGYILRGHMNERTLLNNVMVVNLENTKHTHPLSLSLLPISILSFIEWNGAEEVLREIGNVSRCLVASSSMYYDWLIVSAYC